MPEISRQQVRVDCAAKRLPLLHLLQLARHHQQQQQQQLALRVVTEIFWSRPALQHAQHVVTTW